MKKERGRTIGKAEQTVAQITEEIERQARAGNFHKAENWRELLLVKYPTALSEIISTAELIEEQKTLRIDKDHLAIWDEFYSMFTLEERNCFFYSTRPAVIPKGKMMIRQGVAVPRLLFIEKGRVTLFHKKGKERILIGQLSHGDILGDETFFHFSTPTFSAGSQTEVVLRYLDKSATAAWEEKCPAVYQRLEDYCLQNYRAGKLLQYKKLEKREYERLKWEGRVHMYLKASDGSVSGDIIRGSVMDVSRNGISYDIHTVKPENAQRLLGREVELEVMLKSVVPSGGLRLSGTVVKVGTLLHDDYSIHLKLDRVLGEDEMEKYFT